MQDPLYNCIKASARLLCQLIFIYISVLTCTQIANYLTKVFHTVIEWPYCLHHGVRIKMTSQIKQYVNSKLSKT